jgi:hypothetical protein
MSRSIGVNVSQEHFRGVNTATLHIRFIRIGAFAPIRPQPETAPSQAAGDRHLALRAAVQKRAMDRSKADNSAGWPCVQCLHDGYRLLGQRGPKLLLDPLQTRAKPSLKGRRNLMIRGEAMAQQCPRGQLDTGILLNE